MQFVILFVRRRRSLLLRGDRIIDVHLFHEGAVLEHLHDHIPLAGGDLLQGHMEHDALAAVAVEGTSLVPAGAFILLSLAAIGHGHAHVAPDLLGGLAQPTGGIFLLQEVLRLGGVGLGLLHLRHGGQLAGIEILGHFAGVESGHLAGIEGRHLSGIKFFVCHVWFFLSIMFLQN